MTTPTSGLASICAPAKRWPKPRPPRNGSNANPCPLPESSAMVGVTPTDPRAEALRLYRETMLSIQDIAFGVHVSYATVRNWVAQEFTEAQIKERGNALREAATAKRGIGNMTDEEFERRKLAVREGRDPDG